MYGNSFYDVTVHNQTYRLETLYTGIVVGIGGPDAIKGIPWPSHLDIHEVEQFVKEHNGTIKLDSGQNTSLTKEHKLTWQTSQQHNASH